MIRFLLSTLIVLAAGATPHQSTRLTKPWSQLTGLSEEQRQRLVEIHRRARTEIQQILQKEYRDSLAVLTQEQLDQLRNLQDQQTIDHKLSTTQPADSAE